MAGDSHNQTPVPGASNSKALANGTASASRPLPKPAVPSSPKAPRINMEPLYSALKAATGDDWNLYKESISLFLLGRINQAELARKIDPFICSNRETVRLHNQFCVAVLANAARDPPEPGVASWVSANDKPTTGIKPATGDAMEQRLKTDIMQLPARERHRLKGIQNEHDDAFQASTQQLLESRYIRQPSFSAGGSDKTNWELEIGKRYAQPLFSESNEFPDAESLQARMVPMCYEEGLVKGCTAGSSEFMNIATETFIKELLSDLISRVRTNGANFVKTTKYRRQYEYQEAVAKTGTGSVQRNAAGLLPVEVEAEAKWRPLSLADLKVALLLGNNYLSQSRLLNETLLIGTYIEDEDERETDDMRSSTMSAPKTNGTTVNGHRNEDDMNIDDPEFFWLPGASGDHNALSGVLDDCLSYS
ncbi:putative transcriptional co-activator [Trichodelitschia bisporula]|uniref:Putative transcriptional co-activator n=1 Tax=Trichodelitschia bisporula TaxID=703511 RepID=A0A6G1I340_9PEZI|nr:putative transcriptional co-activator [Trichodelitschia bisporula]